MEERLAQSPDTVPVRIRPVPPPRLRRHDERPRFMVSGYWVSIPMQKAHPPGSCSYGLCPQSRPIRIRPGRVSLPLSRCLRGSQPCGCTSPETGNDLLSLFPSPAEAGHMVGVAQRKSGGLQNRMPRVRIPPRPPGRIRVRCQKWESPNLSKADSRQRPPAGIEPCPAVIWDSSSDGRATALWAGAPAP